MSIPAVVTVVGSGTMGPGIAAVFARAGAQVRVYDVVAEALTRAEQAVAMCEGVLDNLGSNKVDGGSVSYTTDIAEALRGTEFVLEAVPEREDLKKSVLAQIEAEVSDETIIASNTSGIPITKLGEALNAPARFIGMHWSNPPHLIPMIEVVPGEQTSDAVRDRLIEIVNAFGYEAVLEREVPGFVENRVLYAIMRECLALVDEGVISERDLDTAVRWGIGYKLAVVGPMRLLDMAGLDIYTSVAGYLNRDLSNTDGVPAFISDRVASGKLGFKSGGGIFEYGEGDVAALRGEIVRQLTAVRKAMPAPLSDNPV
ncbi:3-hydroxyacyl-CoA dehydrogenase NAD-binding domain-containing protein [Ruicaihuangia caeni]|uniref:3-hydroxyacyl-CoA dehydrogenase NAD-binding domain-containing protein n=1 Tax=Ruicaihuangia caeni TaxID=3042517 RepID=A0AAW6T968_9MICO|nr:3-hydroxyacyl-CoA dehydrogenase NAD-binding domain-containing protein [Klugiella sp. YN-L-19]MDI2098605.1 3-hydroxyacyl-CoA dehydrogenase NAD-binding domain-containing protein [Klugiella sp. YN-L-19]